MIGGRRSERHVPGASYVVNGDRRSFALLRPIADTTANERTRPNPRGLRVVRRGGGGGDRLTAVVPTAERFGASPLKSGRRTATVGRFGCDRRTGHSNH